MNALNYKCPACGSSLIYDGIQEKMKCNSCSNVFDAEDIKQMTELEQSGNDFGEDYWNIHDSKYSSGDASGVKSYSCKNCGASLVTDETTVATRCAFCGSPSIIEAQFTDETRPEKLIPFKISAQNAKKIFSDYFKKRKLLLPNNFQQGLRVEEVRQLYLPYWMFDSKVSASFDFDATRVSSYRSGNYEVTKVAHYFLKRSGSLDFKDLPIDASKIFDNKISESLEPYNMANALEYSPEQLSGALANRADVSADECVERAKERMTKTTEAVFKGTTSGYTTVTTLKSELGFRTDSAMPALLPVWVMSLKKADKFYSFAINGQTGNFTCNFPYSKAKAFSFFLGSTALISGLGFGIVYVLKLMGVL